MSSDKMEQKLKNAELFRDCINEKLKTNPPNSEWLQKLADIVTESSQIDSDDEDDSETESIKSHDDIDDHGVLCHYSRTTGGWKPIEPSCVKCGYGDDNCECEEEKTNCECPFPKFNVVDRIYTCRWCELPDHYKNGVVSDWSDSEDEDEDEDDSEEECCDCRNFGDDGCKCDCHSNCEDEDDADECLYPKYQCQRCNDKGEYPLNENGICGFCVNDTVFVCEDCNKNIDYCECPACCSDCGKVHLPDECEDDDNA